MKTAYINIKEPYITIDFEKTGKETKRIILNATWNFHKQISNFVDAGWNVRLQIYKTENNIKEE